MEANNEKLENSRYVVNVCIFHNVLNFKGQVAYTVFLQIRQEFPIRHVFLKWHLFVNQAFISHLRTYNTYLSDKKYQQLQVIQVCLIYM